MSSAEIDFRSSGEAKALVARPADCRRGRGWLAAYLALKILGTVVVTGVFASAVEQWTTAAWVALGLVAVGALWISGGAATAMLGFVQSDPSSASIPLAWQPLHKTAILVLLCGEPAEPLAAYLRTLRRRADAMGLADTVSIFVLSDTRGAQRIAHEEAALASLVDQESIIYRRRAANTGLKPGNIAEWVNGAGKEFSYMAVLDSDSRMSAERIRSLIFQIERRPDLGLLQAGISMVPGHTLFGRHQRLANRLLSPNFGRGLAAWSGDVGNYWGHNAIMRIPAFRSALALPVLSGRAPFGGPPLSHDFVEAAWIRRAGWAVALDPDTRGSAEDGPQTLGEFYRRDRRWCQGNLQHLRILGEPGLDPVSRLHLASGVAGYLVAPAWLALLVIIAADLVTVRGARPLATVAIILLLPKLVAFAHFARRARTAGRIRVILRASLSELALSALLAPLVMLRQSGAVLSVIMGRDCGWKSDRSSRLALFPWLPEVSIGAALLALAVASAATSVTWLLPVALPLLGAPVLRRWLERDV
ncbi:MAG: glucans biosynthesis glucosyltransferase MdoH [Pseudomonadota bacterium]